MRGVHFLRWCLLAAVCAIPAAAESPLPHAVFLVSEDPHNYEAHATIPPFAAWLEQEHDFRTTVLQRAGEANAYSFPGLEALDDADLLVVFVRRTCLPDADMARIRRHIESGKTVIGIRTANHAFAVREADGEIPEGYTDWWDFVPAVLGCENRGYGPVEPGTAVSIVEDAANHPILEGIEPAWHSPGNVYRVAPLVDEDATVLLEGRVEGEDAVEPIAWTRTTEHGGKVFYTSLGHLGDFEAPSFRRLLSNAIQWALTAVEGSQS
jgi:type 1 glutamine amidotransferase